MLDSLILNSNAITRNQAKEYMPKSLILNSDTISLIDERAQAIINRFPHTLDFPCSSNDKANSTYSLGCGSTCSGGCYGGCVGDCAGSKK